MELSSAALSPEEAEQAAIKRTQAGDREAFHILVDRHGRAVYRLAYRMTNNPNDAEDLVQETFLRAWKQIGSFDGPASFGTWLHRICTNCSLDRIRFRNRKQEVQPDLGWERNTTTQPNPERLAASAQVTASLLPALDQLTPMERMAFVLRHHEGLGIEEISVALKVQPGAAKNTVFRAVQKLRRSLAPMRGAAC